MKAKTNIKTIFTIVPFLGLVLLLLLSPCKVRNFIQSELGIPQTKVSNKSQTTVSNSNCSSYEVTIDTLAKKKSHPLQSAVITPKVDFVLTNFNTNFSFSYKARNHSTLSIPLYILYQNFKDYL